MRTVPRKNINYKARDSRYDCECVLRRVCAEEGESDVSGESETLLASVVSGEPEEEEETDM